MRCAETQRKIDFQLFIKYRKKYKGILNLFKHTNLKRNIINKYHHKPVLYTNKLAYLAGLIDGEGCLKTEKQSKTMRLIIGMTDKKAIFWCKKEFGGVIYLQKTKKGLPFYVWTLNQGKDMYYLLMLVIPFLITKKQKLIKGYKHLLDLLGKLEHTLYPYNWDK